MPRRKSRSKYRGPTPARIAEAAAILFATCNQTETGRRLGLNRRTIYRWCRRPDLQAEFGRLEEEWRAAQAAAVNRRHGLAAPPVAAERLT